MKYLDLSFADPAANLACDEALLELVEAEKGDGILRLWEPSSYFIVLGHSNRLNSEVHDAAVAEEKIPILRRTSGGGAVMQGPGCLNYALVLDAFSRGLTNVRETFRCVLKRHAAVIESLAGTKTRIEGISDLALDGRKFSGNAQYRKSRFVLVHGTFLLRFDLPLIERFLKVPARQPDYRANRPHIEFLTNLNLESARLADALSRAWDAQEESIRVPMERIQTLIDERYGQASWTKKF